MTQPANNPFAEQTNDTGPEVFETTLVDQFPSLFLDQPNNEIFGNYYITNRYEHDFHRYMLGITSPGGFKNKKAAFVQLAAPTLLWICEWVATKIGNQPTIPNLTPPDGNWVLLDSLVGLPQVITPDGFKPAYQIRGTYVYGHVGPDDNTFTNTAFPLPPYLDESGFLRTIPTGLQKPGISVPGGSTGGGSTGTDSAGGPTVPFKPITGYVKD